MKRLKREWTASLVAAALSMAMANAASGDSLDYSILSHGEAVTSQFSAQGVNISGINISPGNGNLAVAFDTNVSGTQDPDLEGPNWDFGNLAPNTNVGKIVILQENDPGVAVPNDEGDQPAGFIIYRFDTPITSFGFDLIDIEGSSETTAKNVSGTGLPITGTDLLPGLFFFSGGTLADGGTLLSSVSFASLPTRDASVVFGDHSANNITPFTTTELAIDPFDTVVFFLGGSGGASGNITFEPEPAPGIPLPAALPAGLMLLGLAGFGKRRNTIA